MVVYVLFPLIFFFFLWGSVLPIGGRWVGGLKMVMYG